MHRLILLVVLVWTTQASAETSWLYKLSVLRFGKETLVKPDNGMIDLRGLGAREYYHVHGEVLFFPGEFLEPKHYTTDEIAQLTADKKPLRVNLNMKIDPHVIESSAVNHGTFLLPVRHEKPADLALAMPRFYHPITLYLATASESRTLLKAGVLSQDPAANESFGLAEAPIPTFHAAGDFTLVAHVSSPLDHGRNQLNLSSFYLGDAHYLLDVLYESRFIIQAISGSFATIFIFYLCIFLFRPADTSSLHLSLYALFSFPVSLFYIFDLGLGPRQFLITGTICFLLGVGALLFYSMEKIAFLYPPKLHRRAQSIIMILWSLTCIAMQFPDTKPLALLFTLDFLGASVIVLVTLYSGLKHRLAGMLFFVGGGVFCLFFIFPMVLSFPTDADYEYGCNMLLGNLSVALSFALMNAKEFAVTYQQSLQQRRDLERKNREITRFNRNLERLVVEKTQLSEEVENRNAEINQINSNLEGMVEDRTRSIQAILRNIRQGILTVSDRELSIDEQYSLYLHEITRDITIAGESLDSLLLARSHLRPDEISMCSNILKGVIGQNVLEFELNQSHLPRDIVLTFQGRVRYCELDWDPICDDHDRVQKVLLAIKDVTELRQQKFENEKLDAEIAILIAIVKAGKRAFLNFIISSKMRLFQCREFMLDNFDQVEACQHIMVNLHTLKGNGRSLGFQDYSSVIHAAEQRILELLQKKTFTDAEVDAVISHVVMEHERLEGLALEKLTWRVEDQQQFEINRSDYLKLLNLVESYVAGRQDIQPLQDMVQLFARQSFPLLRQALLELTQEAQSIARKLRKIPPRIDLAVPERPLADEGYRLLQTIIPHLLANSIDHGIERPEVRATRGKPEQGRISIHHRTAGADAVLEFHDDGQGLDLHKIAMRSGRLELWPCRTQEARDELAELIFVSGISTKDVATEISGRGVGVSAVRELLRQHGGSIRILTQKVEVSEGIPYFPFTFEIVLPQSLFVFTQNA